MARFLSSPAEARITAGSSRQPPAGQRRRPGRGFVCHFFTGGRVMLARLNDWNAFPVFGSSRTFPVSTLRRELDRLFGDLERAPSFAASTPTVKFEDSAEAFTLRTELPGLTEKDIDINVTANVLTLKANRVVEAPE